MVDLQIKNALIYDGGGATPYYGNVAVSDGKIISVGDETTLAKSTVDAEGLALTPGFIDVHSHADQSIIEDSHRDHVLAMGVTTELGGQCGDAIAPNDERNFPFMSERQKKGSFPSLADAIRKLDTLSLGPNQRYFTGHGQLRYAVLGASSQNADERHISAMKEALAHEMQGGSAGISTGLSYVPGIYSDTHELASLAATVGKYGGIYTTHSRSESMGLFDSVRECIDIARIGQVPVNISHFKCVGKVFWERCEEALSMIDAAIAEGASITLDAYPYIATSTTTLSVIPPAFLDRGVEAFVKSLNDPNVVSAIYRDIYEVNDPSWDNSMYYVGLDKFLIVRAEETPEYIGKTYAEAGEMLGISPFEAVIRLLKANHGHVLECRFSMCEENVKTIFRHPHCMVGSDGIYVPGDKSCHPRAFGTFPRYLGRYIREEGILSREEGIRRITSLPAEVYGLSGKGRIATGYDADLVLFDYDRIIDRADFFHPFAKNEGIKQVYVNGILAMEENQPTGAYGGRYLRYAGNKP